MLLLPPPWDGFKADIYSLGVILYTLLILNFPYETKRYARNRRDAYNQKDYTTLDSLVSDNVVLKEMGYTVIQSKKAFIDLVEWGEVFNAKNELKKLSREKGKIVAFELEHSDRIDFLYGEPIKTKTTFTIEHRKITIIEVELIDFDQEKMTKKNNLFHDWIGKNHTVSSAVINQLNRSGGEAFKEAMELYRDAQ